MPFSGILTLGIYRFLIFAIFFTSNAVHEVKFLDIFELTVSTGNNLSHRMDVANTLYGAIFD